MRDKYLSMPTDYIGELKESGKNFKAMCFMDYYYDVEYKRVKSYEDYRKDWGLTSKGSVFKWIAEFKNEIERYFNFWVMKNNQHYSSVKKSSERKVNGKCTIEHPQTPTTPRVLESNGTASERQVNKSNIIVVEKGEDHKFRTIFSLFGFFGMSGKRSEALDIYEKIDDIEFENLVYAIRMYLNDSRITHKLWLPNFLKEKIYVNYMKQTFKIFINGEWKIGKYDAAKEVFETQEQNYKLTKQRINELLDSKELEFITQEVAVA
ncbi:MAG: hypothetical protein PHE73_03530 [Sulfurovaceae bacterium]|nr:hypothetical protein [Sulfurovaceae bacterium]